MTLRCQGTIAADEGRTQGGKIAALFARPRTLHRAGQRVLAAVVSFFSSLLGTHGRIRTCDTWLRRPVLYPLSYVGTRSAGRTRTPTALRTAPARGHYTRSRGRPQPSRPLKNGVPAATTGSATQCVVLSGAHSAAIGPSLRPCLGRAHRALAARHCSSAAFYRPFSRQGEQCLFRGTAP